MDKFIKFIDDLYKDYKYSIYIHQLEKKKCFRRAIGHLASTAWSFISAPVIYPIWYMLRFKLKASYYEVKDFDNDIQSTIKPIKEVSSKLGYWLWTYGDLHDPLGRGGMPEDYRDGKNNFKNRYMFSAIRNPRFTYNYIKYESGVINKETVVIDDRDYDKMIRSYGVGDTPEGTLFKWMIDKDGKWYFIYENSTEESSFWFGWVGLKREPVGKKGRFEIAYRR